jgi:hypothetical protein
MDRLAAAPDIRVENHGSVVLLRPATAAGRAWLKANCDSTGYQPFTGGTVVCEPRFAADIIVGAREAGLRVAVAR